MNYDENLLRRFYLQYASMSYVLREDRLQQYCCPVATNHCSCFFDCLSRRPHPLMSVPSAMIHSRRKGGGETEEENHGSL